MKKPLFTLTVACLCLIAMSCCAKKCMMHMKPFKAPPIEGAKPWTKQLQPNPGQFTFAIVTDRFSGQRKAVFREAVRKLNLLQPDFVMSVGVKTET